MEKSNNQKFILETEKKLGASQPEVFTIRLARPSDCEDIVNLHNSWSVQNLSGDLNSGFLLLETSYDKIESLFIQENILLVAFIETRFAGYLIAVRKPELLDQLNWIEPLETRIASEGHYHITEMAVQRNLVGKGIGKSLYLNFFNRSVGSHLSAYVAISPYLNKSSIAFHEKMGFRPVASFHAEAFCGLKDYSSTLFFREASN